MRRIVIAIASTVTGLLLLLGYPTSLNRTTVGADATGSTGVPGSSGPAAPSDASGSTGSGSSGSPGSDSSKGSTSQSGVSGTFTGNPAQTRYGAVQVRIVVKNGAVSAADAVQHPNRDRESAQINSYAIPVLNDEVVSAQSANVSMISGATVTSRGYLTSLQSAFDQAGL